MFTMTFKLDSNEIQLKRSLKGLRLLTNTGDNLLLANVGMSEARQVVTGNYETVKAHYLSLTGDSIIAADLERVALKIVLNYFYMYQLWRTMYAPEKNRNLAFLPKDFDHPSTGDVIIFYFRSAYPGRHSVPCEIMLGMNAEEFAAHEKSRQAFYDK